MIPSFNNAPPKNVIVCRSLLKRIRVTKPTIIATGAKLLIAKSCPIISPFGYSTCVSENAFHSMSVIVLVAKDCGQARGREKARQNCVVQSAVEIVSITPLPSPLKQNLFTL